MPATAVRPKPQPISSALATSRAVRLRPSSSRVSGSWSSTISTPFRLATRPYSAVEMPCRPMSIASVVGPCWKTRASSRFTPTTAMNAPSRNTAPRPTAASVGSSAASASASAFASVSGTFTNTSTAHSTVVSASSRNSVR